MAKGKFTINQVNWKQFSSMNGNKKNILQRQSFSEGKMSRSSTCKTLSINCGTINLISE